MEISNGGKKSGKNGILIVLAGDVQILQSEEHLLGIHPSPI